MTSGHPAQSRLSAALASLGAHAFETHGSMLRFEAPRESARAAAIALLQQQPLDLILMVAVDRRSALNCFQLCYLFSQPEEGWIVQMRTEIPASDPRFDSIATTCYPASRYEREIHDLFGLEPQEHPDLRPLVRHGFWPADYYPLRKDACPSAEFSDDGQPFPFHPVEGEGVYEIPVGPVHAGIIEPGHFRFSVDGETIIDMKARLYFTHKGTEKLFEGRSPHEGVQLAERISGDTSVGHSLAFCEALEMLAQTEVPLRARYWRVILLELERLYNHVGDLGAIANDTGFGLAHAHALTIRERLLRLNKAVAGHRLLRGVLQPGGITSEPAHCTQITPELRWVQQNFEQLVDLCWNHSMLRDRLRGTGRLTERTARDHGVLGYVARASGIPRDVRKDHPFAAYSLLEFTPALFTSGDVEARFQVRVEEFRTSIDLVRQCIENLPPGDTAAPLGPLPVGQEGVGMVEAWRGGVIHWLTVDETGALDRVKVKDPSFVNWPPLTFALLKNIVPDFPLCNKSFNLSYSGNDL